MERFRLSQLALLFRVNTRNLKRMKNQSNRPGGKKTSQDTQTSEENKKDSTQNRPQTRSENQPRAENAGEVRSQKGNERDDSPKTHQDSNTTSRTDVRNADRGRLPGTKAELEEEGQIAENDEDEDQQNSAGK